MKTKLLMVLLGSTLLAAGCTTSRYKSETWEYKVVSGRTDAPLQREINNAADEGWVLVSASGSGTTGDAFAVMKRAKK